MIREFEGLHARGELEVEILIEVGLRTATAVEELRAFQAQHFSANEPQHWWLEAIIRYRVFGVDGLSAWVEEDRDKFRFVTGLLEGLKSADAIALLATFSMQQLSTNEATQVVSAVNLIMSFEPMPSVSGQILSQLRTFLHEQLASSDPEKVASSMYALREVGDMASLQILKKLPEPLSPYSRARRLAMDRIRKRWS